MTRNRSVLLSAQLLVLLVCSAGMPAQAQTGGANGSGENPVAAFFARWDERALDAQANQPNWLTPAVTSTARLKQEVRYDMSWQSNDGEPTADNYGGSKGFATVPIGRVEVNVNLPPYIVHNGSSQRDGFGDFSLMVKFRIAAANRKHGDYVVTAFLASTFPTGSYKNGSPHPVVTPTIAAGKGLGNLVLQGTFGCDLPSAQTALLGRRMILNNAVQYRGWGKIWPELEANSNFYNEGPDGGKKQVYLTPGISAGRFVIYGHVQLTLAGGIEIAATHFHSAVRQPVFSVRVPF